MSTKVFLGGLIAGIALFLLGYLVFGLLLSGMMESYSNAACMRSMEDMSLGYMFFGNLFMGLAIAYIYSRWTGANSFSAGAKAGAILGLLISLGMDLFMFGLTTMWTEQMGFVVDVIGSVVIWTIVGGIVGWWFGRK
jgi:hypothetical protein